MTQKTVQDIYKDQGLDERTRVLIDMRFDPDFPQQLPETSEKNHIEGGILEHGVAVRNERNKQLNADIGEQLNYLKTTQIDVEQVENIESNFDKRLADIGQDSIRNTARLRQDIDSTHKRRNNLLTTRESHADHGPHRLSLLVMTGLVMVFETLFNGIAYFGAGNPGGLIGAWGACGLVAAVNTGAGFGTGDFFARFLRNRAASISLKVFSALSIGIVLAFVVTVNAFFALRRSGGDAYDFMTISLFLFGIGIYVFVTKKWLDAPKADGELSRLEKRLERLRAEAVNMTQFYRDEIIGLAEHTHERLDDLIGAEGEDLRVAILALKDCEHALSDYRQDIDHMRVLHEELINLHRSQVRRQVEDCPAYFNDPVDLAEHFPEAVSIDQLREAVAGFESAFDKLQANANMAHKHVDAAMEAYLKRLDSADSKPRFVPQETLQAAE